MIISGINLFSARNSYKHSIVFPDLPDIYRLASRCLSLITSLLIANQGDK